MIYESTSECDTQSAELIQDSAFFGGGGGMAVVAYCHPQALRLASKFVLIEIIVKERVNLSYIRSIDSFLIH